MKLSHPEKIEFQRIRNIIFDWGGVITNISYQKTIDAFKLLGIDNFKEYFSQHQLNNLFVNYEIGAISSEELRIELHKAMNPDVTDEQIDQAWCAMLLDTPKKNIDILKQFAKSFRIFLLSNTNDIHTKYYNKHLKDSLNIDYPDLFEKVYYSHVVGKRKPNADIFTYVLNDCKLLPSETLFIDDTEMNVDTADKLDIIAFYLKPGLSLENIFNQWHR